MHVLREHAERLPAAASTLVASAVNGGQTATSTPRRQPAGQLADERAGLRRRLVHLPVAGDERAPAHAVGLLQRGDARQLLPSSSSSAAPPPVETCVIRSATPACVDRRDRVAAADHGDAAGVGDRVGDRRRAAGERLHLEHAHRAVPEDRLAPRPAAARTAATVRGPTSSAHPVVRDRVGVDRRGARRRRRTGRRRPRPPAAPARSHAPPRRPSRRRAISWPSASSCQRRRRRAALRREERVRHRAADQDRVAPAR